MNHQVFHRLIKRIGSFKLDDALVYLNYVLLASQDPSLNPTIRRFAKQNPDAITEFKIEFLAKWLIIKSSILSPYPLDWRSYLELSALYNQMNDPIVDDLTFHGRNPVDLFVRLLYQQLPSQERIPMQSFGSAYMLFQEIGSRLAQTIGYNIPERFRELVGLSIEQFMHLGLVFYAGKSGPFRTPGTICLDYLRKAQAEGIGVISDENVNRFLAVASCTIDEFRDLATQHHFTVSDPAYVLYEFNPLKKCPLTQIRFDRWVAPNPALIIDRITYGIYYDLLDADHEKFTRAFGYVFEEYIGSLLKSVYPQTHVVRERTYSHGKLEKRGPADWVVVERNSLLLFECKSLIPSLDFVSIADAGDVERYAQRIGDAIEQVYKHIKAIQADVPDLQQFAGYRCTVAVLTMGRVQAVNSVFFRKEIDEVLTKKGIVNLPYSVLSLQELEQYLSLVERGVSFTDILQALESANLQEVLLPYHDMLRESAVPSILMEKGKYVIDFFR